MKEGQPRGSILELRLDRSRGFNLLKTLRVLKHTLGDALLDTRSCPLAVRFLPRVPEANGSIPTLRAILLFDRKSSIRLRCYIFFAFGHLSAT